jgi:hypothetical protein
MSIHNKETMTMTTTKYIYVKTESHVWFVAIQKDTYQLYPVPCFFYWVYIAALASCLTDVELRAKYGV